jgi:O-antigen/teichoic acid export membrane protein
MVNQWLGNEQVGLYSAAQTLAELSTNLPIAAAPVIFTLTAKDHFSGIQLVLKTNRLISFLILVGNLVVAVLCIPLLYIYGPKFPEAKYALWLMLPGMQAYSVVLVLRSHFQGLGFPLPTLVIPFVGLVVNSSLNLWLLPMIGISGASLSLTFGYIAMTLLSVWYLKIRNPGITLSELFMITPSEVSDYLAYLRRNSRRLLLHVEK